MKKFIITILATLLILGLCSCDPYADQLDRMQGEIESLRYRVDNIDTVLLNVNSSIDVLEDAVDNLDNESQSEKLKTQITTLKGDLSTLKEGDSENKEQIEALIDRLDELLRRVSNLETNRAVANAETFEVELGRLIDKEKLEKGANFDFVMMTCKNSIWYLEKISYAIDVDHLIATHDFCGWLDLDKNALIMKGGEAGDIVCFCAYDNHEAVILNIEGSRDVAYLEIEALNTCDASLKVEGGEAPFSEVHFHQGERYILELPLNTKCCLIASGRRLDVWPQSQRFVSTEF